MRFHFNGSPSVDQSITHSPDGTVVLVLVLVFVLDWVMSTLIVVVPRTSLCESSLFFNNAYCVAKVLHRRQETGDDDRPPTTTPTSHTLVVSIRPHEYMTHRNSPCRLPVARDSADGHRRMHTNDNNRNPFYGIHKGFIFQYGGGIICGYIYGSGPHHSSLVNREKRFHSRFLRANKP